MASSNAGGEGIDLERSIHTASTPTTITRAHSNPEKENEDADATEKQAGTSSADEADPNVIFWDGPDDPECPMNWPSRLKLSNVVVISTWTLLTPLASSMVAPGTAGILNEFHSTSTTLGSFVVSIFILGYAVGPLVIAPLSEIYGRIPVYAVCNVLFLIWTLACAFAPNLGGLLAFRFLEGVAGVCSLTIGSGTISDIIPAERRGAFMSVYTMGPLLGPVIGPIAGAFLSEKEGWRWVFRVLTIAAGVMTIVALAVLRETCHPIVLGRKVKRLQKATGNQNLRSKLDSGLTPKEIIRRAMLRPTKMLFLSPIVFLLSLYMAIVYGYLYLLFTTITSVYEDVYGWNSGVAGLSYLGIGIGMFLGLIFFGFFSDRIVTHLATKNGTGRKPEYRLPSLVIGAVLIPIGLFWYGWSAEKKIHYIMPIIGTFWVGAGLILSFMPISTYLVDAFTIYAASAMAANTVLRSLAGAFLPLAGPPMYSKLGLGWGNSVLGFIALLIGPVCLLFYRYGERIRTSERFKVEF